VVVDEIEDLDPGGIGEVPFGGVGLPELVGQLGLEADEGGLGPLVRLGCDQAVALEDAPDSGPRRWVGEAAGEVMEDGLRPSVEASRNQLLAELEDGIDDGLVDLMGQELGRWDPGSRAAGPSRR
jgi:hypothetical protein